MEDITQFHMHTRVHWVFQYKNDASLGIMARPRGGEWLEDEISSLKKQNIGLLVSLLEKQEVDELDLKQEERICYQKGVEYFNFPISDRNIPSNAAKVDDLINRINDKIKTGKSVAIHCRMGIGRSSIIAGCVLQLAGFKTTEIIELISRIRGLRVPDTQMQVKWLRDRE